MSATKQENEQKKKTISFSSLVYTMIFFYEISNNGPKCTFRYIHRIHFVRICRYHSLLSPSFILLTVFFVLLFVPFFCVFKICNNWHTRFALYSVFIQRFNAMIVSFLNSVCCVLMRLAFRQKVFFFIIILSFFTFFYLISCFNVVLFSNL